MIKRIKIILLIFILNIIHVQNIYSQTQINTQIYSVGGIFVSEVKATYTDNNKIYLEYIAECTADYTMDINVELDVTDSTGKTIANTFFRRKIEPQKSFPLIYSSNISGAEGEINARLTIRLPENDNTIYVSEYGSDLNDGSYSFPYRSIEKAIEKLSILNSDEEFYGKDVTVVLAEGTYTVDNTINITEYENLNSVKITSEMSDTFISSGLSLKGSDFELITNSDVLERFPENVRDKIYGVNLVKYGLVNLSSAFKNGKSQENDPILTEMYVNGENAQIAKYPDEGYISATAELNENHKIVKVSSESFKNWNYADEAWIRGWFVYDWDLNKGYLNQYDPVNKTVTFDPAGNKCFSGFSAADAGEYYDKKCYVYNLPEELNKEGEYVIYQNYLYYYPHEADVESGEFENAHINLNTSKNNIFEISGTKNLTIEGITFENSKGYFIDAETDNLQILGCTFRNNASNAVRVNGNGNLVYACDFLNLGGSGLEISGGDRNTLTPGGSVVDNCLFDTVSQIYRTNCAPLYVMGCGTTASHNTIRNNPHSSISFRGNDNVMEYNDISNGLTDGSTDAGLFYAGRNLSSLGNQIRNNYIHDSNGGMACIYLDDFLSGQYCNYNLFENIDNGEYTAIFIHAGVNNEFKGNIVIDANIGVRIRAKGSMSDGLVNEWNESYTNYTLLNELKTLPWKSEIWQSKYGNTLKYVNNKTTRIAEGNSSIDNIFINVKDEIYSYDAGQKDSDLIQSGNVMTTTPDENTQQRITNLKNECGIYYDSVYRPEI